MSLTSIDHTLRWQDQTLVLTADRAVFWVEQRLLFLADVHFGKAMSFRRAGIAVPSGQTEHDLARMRALVMRFKPDKLLILGDLMHCKPAALEPWISALSEFKAAFAPMACQIIAGNHDRHRNNALPDWDWLINSLDIYPFRFTHEPSTKAGFYSFAGHVHPCISLRMAGGNLRLPAYCFAEQQALIPSFGSFTGGFTVSQRDYSRVFVVSDRVQEVGMRHFVIPAQAGIQVP